MNEIKTSPQRILAKKYSQFILNEDLDAYHPCLDSLARFLISLSIEQPDAYKHMENYIKKVEG